MQRERERELEVENANNVIHNVKNTYDGINNINNCIHPLLGGCSGSELWHLCKVKLLSNSSDVSPILQGLRRKIIHTNDLNNNSSSSCVSGMDALFGPQDT